MKVLCVTPSYWPAFKYGGPIYSVHSLNKALIKKGVDVTVYSTSAGLDNSVTLNKAVSVDGVKVTYFQFSGFLDFVSENGWQFSMQMLRSLKRNIKNFDIVYIVALWNYPIAVAAHYCRKYNKPYIISPRGTLYPYTLTKSAWRKQLYYSLISRRDLVNANAVHYTSDAEAAECHASLNLHNLSFVIPNGIDIPELAEVTARKRLEARYPALKGKKGLLFLGRINWKKGLDILAKAYGSLARERKDVHLLIAGPDEGNYKRMVKKWLEKEGVAEQVTFTGMLEGKEKIDAFAGSNLFILPSYSENFGMAVVEAMAYGVPVLISDKAGICRDIIQNKAGTVVRTDPKSLYEGINMLLDDPELRGELAQNGRRLVESLYNIDKVADRMGNAYKTILSIEGKNEL